MKIYVKYCGGCNPRFDRKRLAEEAAGRLNAEILYTACGKDDICLLVSGCERNCLKEPESSRVIMINHTDQIEAVVEKILAMKDMR